MSASSAITSLSSSHLSFLQTQTHQQRPSGKTHSPSSTTTTTMASAEHGFGDQTLVFDSFDVDLVVKVLSHTVFSTLHILTAVLLLTLVKAPSSFSSSRFSTGFTDYPSMTQSFFTPQYTSLSCRRFVSIASLIVLHDLLNFNRAFEMDIYPVQKWWQSFLCTKTP